MKKNIIIKFSENIFDSTILDFIQEEIKNYNINDYFYNEYDLIIYFNPNDLNKNCLKNFDVSYWRPWFDDYKDLEKIELLLRISTSRIKECLEICHFKIRNIFVESKKDLNNTEIKLVKIGTYNFKDNKKKIKNLHMNIHLLDNNNIFKIVNLIEYPEYEFYIDERNNNKWMYNELLLKKEQNKKIDINDLTDNEWKQLILKEKITTRELATLYEVSESTIVKCRKKFIANIKKYDDEYLFYNIIFFSIGFNNYYSNFCIPLLEQMKSDKICAIYEYLNLDYNELFRIEEELKHQKEIEKNNLSGKKYVMPLSGILLRKLYWAIKNNQLDRKFLKNNWFITYYGPMFLEKFLERIENSHILELYESGKIYEHPNFETYQELYKRLNLKESEPLPEQILTRVPLLGSKARKKNKKIRKICLTRDYVELTKIKNKVGKTGEELVYNYELEALSGYPELQKKIEQIYLIDDCAGYDIESYDYEGNKIYIEVKTNTLNSDNRIKFYISRLEDEFITNHKNAYIYYVYDLKNPKLRVIDQETYLGYYKKATNYEIDQEIVMEK